jgi:UDP-N-acetylglucosamine 2-epimerase (non-hydrolysing)
MEEKIDGTEKFAFVLGTRPEIIKLSSMIKNCQKRNIPFFIIHTGQHYSPNMDAYFFDGLDLPQPKYNLNIKCASAKHQGEHVGKMLTDIEKVFLDEKPSVVFVQGDTNTVLAGALAASKLHIPLAHVEAGLRSYDNSMPEEINRKITDHISNFLLAPTEVQRKILISEGIDEKNIYVTGNTIVDVVCHYRNILGTKTDIMNQLSLHNKDFILVTLHRQENVDKKERLSSALNGLELVHKKYGYDVVYPIHPRTRKMIQEFDITVPSCITLIEPVGYFDFMALQKNAKLILTDSGGIQEESCILGVPCVTLRDNTERPESIHVGSNILAGILPNEILCASDKMLSGPKTWENPFGDGKSGEKIIDLVLRDKTKRQIDNKEA